VRDPEAVYRGCRQVNPLGHGLDVIVTVDFRPLSPRASQNVWNHSPTGFEWGYGGSGPAQLALALLLDAHAGILRGRALTDLAERAHQWFKWATVSQWGNEWRITAGEIREWVERWKLETCQNPEEDVADLDDVPIITEGTEGGAK
jgi:Family of unknown function (DUF6166)